MSETDRVDMDGPGGAEGTGSIDSAPAFGADAVDCDFPDGPVTHDFQGVPAGTYLCRVDEARPGTTRSGHQRWSLKLRVHRGAEAGRFAAWDGLVFSPKAAARTRQVLAAFGLPHRGRVRLRPADLVGKVAWVQIEEGVYRDPATGVTTKRMQVPYDGVRPAEDIDVDEEDGMAGDAAAENGGDPSGLPF